MRPCRRRQLVFNNFLLELLLIDYDIGFNNSSFFYEKMFLKSLKIFDILIFDILILVAHYYVNNLTIDESVSSLHEK